MIHPLTVGTKILSVDGEPCDPDGDTGPDTSESGPNAVGVITGRAWAAATGWQYQIEFPSVTHPGQVVWVCLYEIGELDDPEAYRVVEYNDDYVVI